MLKYLAHLLMFEEKNGVEDIMKTEKFMLPKNDSAEFLGNSPLNTENNRVVIFLDHVKQIAKHGVIGPDDGVKAAPCEMDDDYPDTLEWLYRKDYHTKGIVAAMRLMVGG